MSEIAAAVQTVMMVMFMLLWAHSDRLLKRAWKREDEYRIIISKLVGSGTDVPSAKPAGTTRRSAAQS